VATLSRIFTHHNIITNCVAVSSNYFAALSVEDRIMHCACLSVRRSSAMAL